MLISSEKSIINIAVVGVFYGFSSFIVFLVLKAVFPNLCWINEFLVSISHMVILYKSEIIGNMITKSRR